jgi:hypothetical protein
MNSTLWLFAAIGILVLIVGIQGAINIRTKRAFNAERELVGKGFGELNAFLINSYRGNLRAIRRQAERDIRAAQVKAISTTLREVGDLEQATGISLSGHTLGEKIVPNTESEDWLHDLLNGRADRPRTATDTVREAARGTGLDIDALLKNGFVPFTMPDGSAALKRSTERVFTWSPGEPIPEHFPEEIKTTLRAAQAHYDAENGESGGGTVDFDAAKMAVEKGVGGVSHPGGSADPMADHEHGSNESFAPERTVPRYPRNVA